MIDLIITCHADQRIKERVGIKSRQARQNYVMKAYGEGLRIGECSGLSLKFMLSRKKEEFAYRELVLFRDQIFVFEKNYLVTVLPTDCDYKKQMDKIRCKHNKKTA